MRIIWQTASGQPTDFEQQFLREVVFAQTPHAVHLDCGSFETPADNALVVYSSFNSKPPQALRDYLARSPGHSLVHISDERLQHDPAQYTRARVVLRSYYDPRSTKDHVFTLPLGFQSGFLNTSGDVDLDAKDMVWCFAGQMKSNRKKMLAALAEFTACKVHLTTQWTDPDALSVDAMAAIYRRSLFAPCPFGYRHPDSFRVMECLEYGCIPVVVAFLGDDYFRYVYGDHPFIVSSTWAKAADHVRALLADPPALRERQRALVEWYARYKRDLALDVRDILNGARRDTLRSKQFQLQKAGMKPRTVRRYNLYFGHGLIRRLFRNYVHAFS
ncbi:MAG: hypothetical protein JWO64_1654 [Hyphomicrobiales bacterium]|jgi:hypothetical protein|nr:hypothetical protein [Hyphomicrobiales bacterium]